MPGQKKTPAKGRRGQLHVTNYPQPDRKGKKVHHM